MKALFLARPQVVLTLQADEKKGGGFEYMGPIVLIEKYPLLVKMVKEVAAKYNLPYAIGARVIGRGHAMMFGMSFTYNRIDQDMMDRVRKSFREGAAFIFDQGGIPWKASVEVQKMAMERMDPNTLNLMKMIKENLDPNGIMNPGNWEVN
jgi:glycolate oxidase